MGVNKPLPIFSINRSLFDGREIEILCDFSLVIMVFMNPGNIDKFDFRNFHGCKGLRKA